MAQQNNTTNWVIQGQPQLLKLLQTCPSAKTINSIATVPGNSVKLVNSSSGTETTSQLYFPVSATTSTQLRAIPSTSKLVSTKGGSTVQVANIPKGAKTIRLMPTQMQAIKLVPTKAVNSIPKSTAAVVPSTSSVTPPLSSNSAITSPANSTPISILFQQPIRSGNNKSACAPTTSTPILAKKRTDGVDVDIHLPPDPKKGRKADKSSKGLRHFSMKVCEKVRKKVTTTYNEVADELVSDFVYANGPPSSLADQYDQKNIRRRVYDALNVLMAMNIISKEKKIIRWIGLPSSSLQECVNLEKEKLKRLSAINEKKKQLRELIMDQVSFKNLAARNREMEEMHGQPAPNSFIHLPFLVISANKKTEIDCNISNDRMEYVFGFNDKFEIIDDVQILKSMGMLLDLNTGKCTPENLEKMKRMVPKALEEYVTQIATTPPGEEFDTNLSEAEAASLSTLITEDFVETTLDEENSHQSSSDPLSPNGCHDYSEEDGESELSSDIE